MRRHALTAGQLRDLLATVPDHVPVLAVVVNIPNSSVEPGSRTDVGAYPHTAAYDAASGTFDIRARVL